jgi:hypothetical protein
MACQPPGVFASFSAGRRLFLGAVMTEIDRLRSENAELRSTVAQADEVLSIVIKLASDCAEAMRLAAVALRDLSPAVAAEADAAVAGWDKFIGGYLAAKETAARQTAPSSETRN